MAYAFDYAGRPVTAGSFVTGAEYLPFGPLSRLQFGNGTTQTFAFDQRYRPTSNELTLGVTPLARYTYGYDAAGNITSILDALDHSYDRTFGYDELNRLVTADTGSALWRKGKYVWDAMGNLLSYELGKIEPGPSDGLLRTQPRPRGDDERLTIPGGRTGAFEYAGATPRITSVTTNDVPRTVQYDAAGNETSYLAARTYSARNLLAQVTDLVEPEDPFRHTLSYGYDGRGIRSIRTESPSNGAGTSARRYFLYSPELRLLSATRDDATNVWSLMSFTAFDKGVSTEIVWFGDRPVAQVTSGGPVRYTFTDHLATPIAQTDATGTITWRAEYEPFGNVYEMRAGYRLEQPLRLPGQEVAMTWEGAEENYNIFRWYRSGWGRYTQGDPIGLSSGVHLYSYVEGNPTNYVDPFGLMTFNWSWGPMPHPSPDPANDCKKPGKQKPNTKVACTNFVAATLDCECACAGLGWEPQVTLHVILDMYVFTGPYKPGMAKDKSIKSFDTAVQHELQKHAAKGAAAVKEWLDKWMKPFYDSKGDCEGACKSAMGVNPGPFFQAGWNASGVNSD